MRILPVIFLLLSIVLSTCIKPPHYSIIPAISNATLALDTVVTDSIDTITFNFTDGDGDLGTNATAVDTGLDSAQCQLYGVDSFFNIACSTAPAAFDLFALDSRVNKGIRCMKLYQIPIIPAQGSSKAISGTISFLTFPLTPAPTQTVDSLFYYIMVRDQAGHCSNIIQTPTIYIVP